MANGNEVQSVNKSSVKSALKVAIKHMGQLLMKFIHAFAQASEEAKIFVAKWDIKDGVWRRDCLEGELLNSCYVLPQKEGEPVRLVVPMTLQMGWIEPPPYFCAASETG